MSTSEIPDRDLVHYLRSIFGAKCELVRLEDLNDGLGKKTYLLWTRRPDTRCILHVWVNPRPDLTDVETDLDLFPYGPRYFAANHKFLLYKGINVPELLLFDNSRTRYDFAFAFVEYIDGTNLLEYKEITDRVTYASVIDQIKG